MPIPDNDSLQEQMELAKKIVVSGTFWDKLQALLIDCLTSVYLIRTENYTSILPHILQNNIRQLPYLFRIACEEGIPGFVTEDCDLAQNMQCIQQKKGEIKSES